MMTGSTPILGTLQMLQNFPMKHWAWWLKCEAELVEQLLHRFVLEHKAQFVDMHWPASASNVSTKFDASGCSSFFFFWALLWWHVLASGGTLWKQPRGPYVWAAQHTVSQGDNGWGNAVVMVTTSLVALYPTIYPHEHLMKSQFCMVKRLNSVIPWHIPITITVQVKLGPISQSRNASRLQRRERAAYKEHCSSWRMKYDGDNYTETITINICIYIYILHIICIRVCIYIYIYIHTQYTYTCVYIYI